MTFSAISHFVFDIAKQAQVALLDLVVSGFEADIEVWGRKIKGGMPLLGNCRFSVTGAT
ncbi:hypothetical protein [Sinorhizobium mexicanum]|uniref:hypothetical protein n=1 Tax=Sinorhizobium mexicanum TaxID=375549 RepID=UPI0015DFCB33|nr:hypothetical protein [Sinorhizobium mexicanum]MBP1887834.1 hypothetical protein [Sinorhizobium mexicanum]